MGLFRQRSAIYVIKMIILYKTVLLSSMSQIPYQWSASIISRKRMWEKWILRDKKKFTTVSTPG